MDLSELAQGAASGLSLGSIYVLVALGLALVFGILRIINFAHGEFLMLGAIATFYLFGRDGLPFVVVLVIVGAAGFLTGIALEWGLYRRFQSNLLGAFVMSLGLSLVIQMMVRELFGVQPRRVPSAIEGVTRFGGVDVANSRVLVIVAGALIVAATYLAIERTQTGRALRAIAENRDAASLMGINAPLLASLGFALGTAMAAVAGVLVSPLFSVSSGMGVDYTVKAFIVIILGGMGSIRGAIVAGLGLGLLEGIGGIYVDNSTLVLAELVLVGLTLIVRPEGLAGVTPA